MSHNETKNLRILREGRKLFAKELDKQLAGLNRSLELCITQLPGRMNNIYTGIAHTLKGSAAMFGFQRIGNLADRLAKLWEWTQDKAPDAGLAKDAEAGALRVALQASPQIVLELTMEHDIARVELEMDEQREQGNASVPRLNSRLLVVDDDEALRSYLVRRLRLDGYEVDEADGVEETPHYSGCPLLSFPVAGMFPIRCDVSIWGRTIT